MKIKQIFCKHEFETVQICGYRFEKGWSHPVVFGQCKKYKKCGKIKQVKKWK